MEAEQRTPVVGLAITPVSMMVAPTILPMVVVLARSVVQAVEEELPLMVIPTTQVVLVLPRQMVVIPVVVVERPGQQVLERMQARIPRVVQHQVMVEQVGPVLLLLVIHRVGLASSTEVVVVVAPEPLQVETATAAMSA